MATLENWSKVISLHRYASACKILACFPLSVLLGWVIYCPLSGTEAVVSVLGLLGCIAFAGLIVAMVRKVASPLEDALVLSRDPDAFPAMVHWLHQEFSKEVRLRSPKVVALVAAVREVAPTYQASLAEPNELVQKHLRGLLDLLFFYGQNDPELRSLSDCIVRALAVNPTEATSAYLGKVPSRKACCECQQQIQDRIQELR